MKSCVVECLLQGEPLLHLLGKLLIDGAQALPRGRQRRARALQCLVQIVSAEGEQPCQENQQADFRGEQPGGIPPCTRPDRYLQVTSGNGSRRRKPDPCPDRVGQGLGPGTDEAARAGAAGLDLRQLEVVTHVGQPRPTAPPPPPSLIAEATRATPPPRHT